MSENKDDDDDIDLDSLGDWRTFRMNLVASSSSSSTVPETSVDGISLSNDDGLISLTSVRKGRVTSVSKRNEELLMAQNENLGEEYIKGVWAHASAIVSGFGYVLVIFCGSRYTSLTHCQHC
jgi:hypothetical protein